MFETFDQLVQWESLGKALVLFEDLGDPLEKCAPFICLRVVRFGKKDV